MEDFGDKFVDSDVDPAADFLAREQNDLAGLEDELKPGVTPIVNGTEPELPVSTVDIEIIEPLDSDSLPAQAITAPPVPPSQPKEKREEAEKISKWREEQKKLLEEKDLLEEKKKEEWRIAAKKELDEWYKHHEELVTKTRASNRNAEKQFVAEEGEIEPGTEWERIAKLCDFNKKSSHNNKDASRMRSIILQLKQTPVLPKTIPDS